MTSRGDHESREGSAFTVSPGAVVKTGRVLYAFSHFYLPFYGHEPIDIFWSFDPFAWISAFVYDVDEGMECGTDVGAGLDRLDELRGYLADRLKVDAAIDQLFDDARRYYRFERRVRNADAAYAIDELVSIARARSFDFRLMHRALSQRHAPEYREELFAWFRSLELLMEIEDDASSVRVDAERGTFNILVLAERISGDNGLKLIGQLRKEAEIDLWERSTVFPEQDKVIVEQVLAAYRHVVPEPVMMPARAKQRESVVRA